ncbi:MAG: hypothetical protein FVQ78_05990 [Solirubrobacterales bacterium]|nr:hypothetical protein [Solirubrobacterales bacterium]
MTRARLHPRAPLVHPGGQQGVDDAQAGRSRGILGELARRVGLVELLDAEIAANRRARPVKVRQRGVSPGELIASLAEAQLAGAECFADVEELRADRAGAELRAVTEVPSAPTALQLAKRFRRSHLQRAERAIARPWSAD